MDDELHWSLDGTAVRLLGDRALYWPEEQVLMIADLHLGKADLFRRAGIALPAGGTHADLQRLQALLIRTGARQLWVLGDLLHGRVHRSAWREHWLHWRQRNAGIDVHVVVGNHDRALPGAQLGVQIHHDTVALGPFLLAHDPVAAPLAGTHTGHFIGGHLHPIVSLPGVPRRFPAFWLRPGSTVLPAFSAFTAGVVPDLRRGERLVVCVEGHAMALPER